MGLINWTTTQFRRLFAGTFAQSADQVRATDPQSRDVTYEVNAAMYDNLIYDAWRGYILSTFFPTVPQTDLIRGYWNPTKQIVDVYQNCLPGVWGEGIEIAKELDDEPVNPKLTDPVRRVWRDSNLDTVKNQVQRYAANLGTVGLRAVRVGESKVIVQHDHPSKLFHVELDTQDNVVAVVLKYKVRSRAAASTIEDPDYFDSDVVEVITKDEFSHTIDGVQQIEDRKNRFGFCPYVILPHRKTETWLGDHAYKGSESVIHAINYRITQQDRSIGRHMFPKWFGAMTGQKPTSIDIGEAEKMIYAQMLPDSPNPILQAIVPQLDQMAGMEFWKSLLANLRVRNPEVALTDLALFANISGETLAQVLKQVEACVLNVRPQYDHAFIRVIQMALSMGMVDRIEGFDVGAGLGEESGDRAYNEGLEAFAFAARPALPLTPAQTKLLADAAVADKAARFTVAGQAQKLGVSADQVLREAGFTDEQIKTIKTEKRTQDVIPTQVL